MATSNALSSSPRLPSPPPFTENQLQTDNPTVSAEPVSSPQQGTGNGNSGNASSISFNHKSHPTIRRIRPGTKSCDISIGPPLVPLSELDSAFQLQEHLASILARSTTRPGARGSEEHTVPLSKMDCDAIAQAPEGIDQKLWCYELTRRLTRDLNVLVVALIRDQCTAKSCPEMRADEWQYLCAAHDPPRSCCAIDYITHTLDNAAGILCSTKYFPSRLNLTASGTKQLSSIFRRLYRIFAHAWFQHRDVFWEVEREYGLYLFFKTVSEHYALIPEDNLTIPPEAEDIEAYIAKQQKDEEYAYAPRTGNGTRHLEDYGSYGEGGDSDSDDSDESDFELELPKEGPQADEARKEEAGESVRENGTGHEGAEDGSVNTEEKQDTDEGQEAESMEEIDVSNLQVSGEEKRDAESQGADGADSVLEGKAQDPFADPEESSAQKGDDKSSDAEPEGKEQEENKENGGESAEAEEVPLAVDPGAKAENAEERKKGEGDKAGEGQTDKPAVEAKDEEAKQEEKQGDKPAEADK